MSLEMCGRDQEGCKGEVDPAKAQSLGYYRKACRNDCPICKIAFAANIIYFYPHDVGWSVAGLKHKQWLYLVCYKCKAEWAIWKLGVPRE